MVTLLAKEQSTPASTWRVDDLSPLPSAEQETMRPSVEGRQPQNE